MDASDSEVSEEVSDSFVDGMLDYSCIQDGHMLAPASSLFLPPPPPPPPTAHQPPPHYQVAPEPIIQDPSETQMSPDDDFIPFPPTEQEIAPYRRLFQRIPDHNQDASETQILLPALTTDEPTHPPHQYTLDHIQDMLTETHLLQAYATPPTTDHEPAHPPHGQNDHPNQIANTPEISAAVITFPPTGSEPGHQHPPHQGALGDQDASKALMLVPANTIPPPTEPQNHDVVIDIESDSESANSDEVRILDSFTPLSLLPPPPPPPPPTTTPSTSRFEEPLHLYPVPISWIHPSGFRLRYHHGKSKDDEKTKTDDSVLPPPPPPQPQPSQASLQLELALALHMASQQYWSTFVNTNSDIGGEPKRPDWLPEDWEMQCVTRTSGSSAGNRDKYYIEPGIGGRKFRSKREVLHFLETGERIQNKRKANSIAMSSNVNGPIGGTASCSRQNFGIGSHLEASTSRQNEESPNLDLVTVPEKQNEETPPNVDSDQNPPKRPRGSPSK